MNSKRMRQIRLMQTISIIKLIKLGIVAGESEDASDLFSEIRSSRLMPSNNK